jgi:phosphohistidine phosphatase
VDVFLVRHGVAHERDAQRWSDDRQRPLTPGGMRRFRNAARGLTRLVPRVDVVWSSRLVRAWQTAEILHAAAGWPAPREWPSLEDGMSPSRVLREVAAQTACQRIVLVGHAPGLDEFAAYAVLGDPGVDLFTLRKGGAAGLRFTDAPRPGGAALLWLATPKLLRRLGGAPGRPSAPPRGGARRRHVGSGGAGEEG